MRAFISASSAEHEAIRSGIAEGRRFRLSGPEKILDEIKARKGRMIEVTGLVRKSQVEDPGGIKIAGGRIRIGGRAPQSPMADPTRDPAYNQVVLDVEGWRPLAESCSAR